METVALVTELKHKIEEFNSDDKISKFYEGTFRAWAFAVDSLIVRGTKSNRLRNKWQQAIDGLPYPSNMVTLGGHEGPLEFMFESRLPEVRATLEEIISEIERFGVPAIDEQADIPRLRPAAVFIAHGGDSESLNKLCAFLQDDLGVKPLVVERLPSEGRSVNENGDYYLEVADAAIVLATGDDLVDGRYQARGNVQIELGRFQERFPERVIFLLEENAAYPSNVSEKVWERFTQSNMEKALKKVVRELRAFGFFGNPSS